jgi:hypothetical protein
VVITVLFPEPNEGRKIAFPGFQTTTMLEEINHIAQGTL